jgi:competence protein CoiA
MYALASEGAKIAAAPERRAVCPGCRLEVVPKCGEIVVWHWAHVALDCDPWHEPECRWHLAWKSIVPPEQCEVVMGPHRTDIVGRNGIVIELQHSAIGPYEIRERETFYRNMVWVFDGTEYSDRFVTYPKQDYFAFRWKHPRKTVAFASKPVFVDLGTEGLFRVGKFYAEGRRGWGKPWSRARFFETYLAVAQP